MNNKELTIEEIHENTLVVLKEIIRICDELQINYFMAYGSLLGAVRHHGFIPWDDDCDIKMLRKDYDAFVTYCVKNASKLKPYKLINLQTEPNYPYGIARFNDMRFRAEYDNMISYESGLFIDIYPLDNVRSTLHLHSCKVKRKLYSVFLHLANRPTYKPAVYIMNRPFKKNLYLIAQKTGKDIWLKRLDALKGSCKDFNSEVVSCITWSESNDIEYRSDYTCFEMLLFENLMVKAPLNYNRILKSKYGDYMTLPSLELQKPHHEYKLYRREENQ